MKQSDTALILNAEHQWLIQKPDKFNRFLDNWLNNLGINKISKEFYR